MFDWIVNRFTSEMCLNYFYQWLEIAIEGSKQIHVPDWNQVTIMIEKSLPKMIFKHKSNVNEPQGNGIKFLSTDIKCRLTRKI